MADFTSRVVSIEQMGRLSRGIDQTYGFTTLGGAVTTSAGMVLAVAATAASTTTINGTVNANAYAGGTVTIGTSDPALPRIDIVWQNSSGTVAVAAGTAASTPIPPTIGATGVEHAMILVGAGVTSITSNDIIDRRQLLASPAVALAGSSSAATSTTSTSAVDLVTISGLSIAVGTPFRVEFNWRKQALAANAVSFGIKVNSTTIYEADGNLAIWTSSGANAAQDGFAIFGCAPRSAATYLGGFYAAGVARTSSTGAVLNGAWSEADTPSAVMPNATITSISIRAINLTASNAAEVTSIRILTGVI